MKNIELLSYKDWINISESEDQTQADYFIVHTEISKEDYVKTADAVLSKLIKESVDDFEISKKYINNKDSTGIILELTIKSPAGNELLGDFEVGSPFTLNVKFYETSLNSVVVSKSEKHSHNITEKERINYPESVKYMLHKSYTLRNGFIFSTKQDPKDPKGIITVKMSPKSIGISVDNFKNKMITYFSEDFKSSLNVKNLGFLISKIYFNENENEKAELITDIEKLLTNTISCYTTIELIKTLDVEKKVLLLSDLKEEINYILSPYYEINYDELSDIQLKQLIFTKLKPDLIRISKYIAKGDPEKSIAANELTKYIIKLKPIINARGIQIDDSE